MSELHAPGLTADWLNAWLAAIGVTVLVDGIRLRWSEHPRPVAILELPGEGDVVAAIAAALPSEDSLSSLAIADENGAFPWHVRIEDYSQASERARSDATDFSLASTVTDLVTGDLSKLPHGRFDLSAEKGRTMWLRVLECRRRVPSAGDALEEAIAETLLGRGMRHELKGLGFDARAVESSDPPGSRYGGKYVDPVVECLAFQGLAFFPVRGDGGNQAMTRGWQRCTGEPGGPRGRTTLRWPVWSPSLDRWAIDALLARAFAARAPSWSALGLGIMRVYEVIEYRKSDPKQQTAGYASRAV